MLCETGENASKKRMFKYEVELNLTFQFNSSLVEDLDSAMKSLENGKKKVGNSARILSDIRRTGK